MTDIAAPMSKEEMSRYSDLIDTSPGSGPALSWTDEARLLTEAQRARAEVDELRARVAELEATYTAMSNEAAARIVQLEQALRKKDSGPRFENNFASDVGLHVQATNIANLDLR